METDFEALRQWMVEEQIMGRGIFDKEVVRSMRVVPRHLFVPTQVQHLAYDDGPLPIGEGQTISQPYIVAAMTLAGEVTPQSKVLEIGTGSGYQAAVLAEIAKEVFSIERVSSLAEKASKVLGELHYNNVHVTVGDGSVGWPEEAPFDVILVTAGAPVIPDSLKSQLEVGGRLVIPVGNLTTQKLMLYRKSKDDSFFEHVLDWVRFVPLIGEEGWQ